MARLRFMVEIPCKEPASNPTHIARNLAFALVNSFEYWWGEGTPDSIPSVTPYQPDPVDAHGQHGVANGARPIAHTRYDFSDEHALAGLDPVRPAPIHQPEERAPTCSCYMGAAAQPFAHEPSCAVHPRYRDYVLSHYDGSSNGVPEARLDHAEQDGQVEDVKAEHAGSSSLAEAGVNPDGPILGVDGYPFSVGGSFFNDSDGKSLV